MIKMVCCWLSGALRWIVVAHPGSSDVLDIITEASYFGYHTLSHDNEASTRARSQTKTSAISSMHRYPVHQIAVES